MSKSDNQMLILETPRATQSHLQGMYDAELQGDWPQGSQFVRTSAAPALPYSIHPPSVPIIALATIPPNENFAPAELGGVSTPPVAKRSFWRRHKGTIILIVAIVVIIVVVVGGVALAKSVQH